KGKRKQEPARAPALPGSAPADARALSTSLTRGGRMKRTAFRVIAFLSVVLPLPQAVEAADDAGLKSVLDGRYAAMRVAMDSRDADAVRRLLAPGFTAISI